MTAPACPPPGTRVAYHTPIGGGRGTIEGQPWLVGGVYVVRLVRVETDTGEKPPAKAVAVACIEDLPQQEARR